MRITTNMRRIIIIGGGAIGLSLAYHLGQRGEQDVLLLERDKLTSGTSWHAAGIVGPLRATPNMTRLAMYAGELFPQLAAQTGQDTGYLRTGGYWLARDPARMDELHRIASLGRHFGLTPQMIDIDTLATADAGSGYRWPDRDDVGGRGCQRQSCRSVYGLRARCQGSGC